MKKVIDTNILADHLLWKLSVGLSLLALLVTSCAPKVSSSVKPSSLARPSGFAKLENPFATPLPPLPVTATPVKPIPVLAYYYIWFDPQSWGRAKADYPLLGRYSSDDPNVIRQHIQWAKEAGITGFIVSWKSTDTLNRRLALLVQIAQQENFKLAIIYQGLNFNRAPLPVKEINADLNFFISHYANNPVFDIFGKPLVIWSGTWKFSPEDVQSVVQGKRDHILILASEKDVQGYQRLAASVDGDAYYWSSVNPDTYSGYTKKLNAMAAAVHANGGLWIAPAASGFDARMIGGTTTVDRKNGQTLLTEIGIALRSAPDALGLISWNEFSENSYIEPSKNYGDLYLKVLASAHLPTPTPTPK